MKNWKETLANIGGIIFGVVIFSGWFQPEGYWWIFGINPYDTADFWSAFIVNFVNYLLLLLGF